MSTHRDDDRPAVREGASLTRRRVRIPRIAGRAWRALVAVAAALALATVALPTAQAAAATSPGPAVRFEVTSPGTVVAGRPFQLGVRAVDASGRTATGYRGEVAFTILFDSPTPVPAPYRFTAQDRGRHVFRGVTLQSVESDHVIVVTQVGVQAPTGRSAFLQVRPGSAHVLLLDVEPHAVVGTTLPVTLAVQDAWGNPTTLVRRVQLSISDGAAGAGVTPSVVRIDRFGFAALVPPQGVTFATPGRQTVTATARATAHLPALTATATVEVRAPAPTGLTAWQWGRELFGSQVTPAQVGDATWAAIAVGGCQRMGLETDGSLWAWGASLCVDETGWLAGPERVGNRTGWADVAVGATLGAAVHSDGTLWVWGEDAPGAGSADVPERMVQMGDGTTWADVSVGDHHALALRTDGSLWAFGRSGDGRLGDGVTEDLLVTEPVPVAAGRTFVAVAAGGSHSLAIASDGSLWAWGANADGQLGDGTTTIRATPVAVAPGRTWSAVSAGGSHTLALATDGSLWAWGSGGSGELGDGTSTSRATPAQVEAGTTWSAGSAGHGYSLAIRSDGTLWAFGLGDQGQLGTGDESSVAAPVQVGDLATWAAVAAGRGQSLGLAEAQGSPTS